MDRSKIEYAKRRLRRKYTGTDLVSPYAFTIGKYYRITIWGIGDDFTNVGAVSNASGIIFKATGTTPTTWTNGSVLNEILLDTLKADADTQFNSATASPLTITRSAYEGGSGEGQITFASEELGEAYEELIQEFDPGYAPPIPRREIGVTVRLGG